MSVFVWVVKITLNELGFYNKGLESAEDDVFLSKTIDVRAGVKDW